MSRDSSRTYLHLPQPHFADLFEEFTRTPLLPEEIYVAPQHQPINPEDEDDVVPDQHAAFGIQRATQKQRTPAWRDLGLDELLARGPTEPVRVSLASRARGAGAGAGAGEGAAAGGSAGSGLPR
ncbi:apc13 domain-containing protein [Diplodia corticola]|uniref:Apc13 domain-containing protein n=1 Tax=Diplodia corticola TaxID=236234 RepID=A0A1J9QMN0_9PEZI|nr:apc13 domain-containing protein [Diplodia corticola]OJD29737.1 apc13 domain-containing protein [Diplodia corticola]